MQINNYQLKKLRIMDAINMFKGFTEKPSDFPMLCAAIATTNAGIKGLEAFLDNSTGISDKILVSVNSVISAFNALKKECVPDGCFL